MPVIPGRWVAQWARAAGFRSTHLVIACAIAAAESGLNTHAHHVTSREDSRGLWQINVMAHPWGRQWALYDARINADAAFRVYREAGRRFTPWSVYLHDTYRQWLPEARQWVTDAGISPGPDPGRADPPQSYQWDWHQLTRMSADRLAEGAHTQMLWGRKMRAYLMD